METVTVTIGRNVGDQPLPAHLWNAFVSDTRRTVELSTVELWASGPTRGSWDGIPEESFFYFGPALDHPDAITSLRARLSTLAAFYGQEAIGLSVGTASLVESITAGIDTGLVPAIVEDVA